MRNRFYELAVTVCMATFSFSTPVPAELSCNPQEAQINFTTQSDPFFESILRRWKQKTDGQDTSRYVEGDNPTKDCTDVQVKGYEGFPTKLCSYRHYDAGDPKKPLAAKVIVLDPSAKQLASWSIHACRISGATDAKMASCLDALFNEVIHDNGAQFPVAGSVVESYCNSGVDKPCAKDSWVSNPRNTWYRNGVPVWYNSLVHWEPTPASDSSYDKVFDTDEFDKDISRWQTVSRVSGAQRGDWRAWRQMKGKPLAPDGVDPGTFDLDSPVKSSWGDVSRAIHQAACKSEANELFDAVVFHRRLAR